MRTAPSRVRRLVGLLIIAVSAGWLLLRRRTGSAFPLPAVVPTPSRPPTEPRTLATDAGLTAEPLAASPPAEAPPAEPPPPGPLAPPPRAEASPAEPTAGEPVEPVTTEPTAGDSVAAEPTAG